MIYFLDEHRPLAIILGAFLALAVTYSIVTPIFEAGDEIWHYPYVQHLATEHSLIVQDPGIKTLWAQEGGQPPLYYVFAALETIWIDTGDLADRLWTNPHASIGIPLLFGNKNMIVHTGAESFPWRNTTLAVHLIRLLSIIFSTATVGFAYLLALEVVNSREMKQISGASGNSKFLVSLPSFAAAFVAFNPMFIFISASVNNDSLAAMLGAFALWLMARMVNASKAHRSSFVALGIVLGLAAITKVSDLGLILVAAVVLLFLCRKSWSAERQALLQRSNAPNTTEFKATLINVCLSATLVVLIGVWWYVRNYFLYSDPFAFNVWVAIAGGRPTAATIGSLLGEFQGLRISFWGNFGGVNIIAPEWVYFFLDGVTAISALGLVAGLVRGTVPRILALPVFWLVLIFIALVRWTSLTFASQGRLLFPAISAMGLLFAFGLMQLTDFRFSSARRSTSTWLPAISVLFLFAFSLLTPFLLIAPAYKLPQRLNADASVPNPTHIFYEDQVELVGYYFANKTPVNSELPMTLYWRGLKPIDEDLSVYIHLFDANGNPIGQWDAFTGNGLYPTRFWQPNEILVDNYRVPFLAGSSTPSVGRVEVGLYRRATMKNLTARDPEGRTITPSIARFKLPGRVDVRIENPLDVNFANRIALVGFGHDERATPGSTLSLRLDWRALAVMEEDYSVFVHVVDANGKLITQKDDQPQHGTYPTSFWEVGETIADAYLIEIPLDTAPGDYHIRAGVYRASDGLRLRAGDADEIDLGLVRIVR